MIELIFIGTLHCGFTNKKELEKIILKINPDFLLVEISNEDIQRNNYMNYPDEMIFALNMAIKKQIPCKGFDSKIKITKVNISKEDELEIIKRQAKIIKKYNWTEFNKSSLNNKLSKISREIINLKKWHQREQEMKVNIKKLLPKNGRVLIITGCGHISFFKQQFPRAKFPLSQ